MASPAYSLNHRALQINVGITGYHADHPSSLAKKRKGFYFPLLLALVKYDQEQKAPEYKVMENLLAILMGSELFYSSYHVLGMSFNKRV